MPLLISHLPGNEISSILQVLIKLSPRIRVRHGDLNRFRVQFHGKPYGSFDRLTSFARKAHLKISVDLEA